MTVEKAIKEIGHGAVIADNPIAYMEAEACKKYFKKLNNHAKKRFPEHRMWENQNLVSYKFTDCIITTINGVIIAIRGLYN